MAFIGPCSAKKLEAMRRSIRSDIDFVLTFEEVMGMFDAKDVNFAELEEDHSMHGATADGRGFAVGGGVAHAVAEYIKENYPGVEVQTERADGLENCRKMLMLAKAGKYNGYLLEGMACPGGCVAGAGTIQPIAKSVGAVSNAMKASSNEHSSTSIYADVLNSLGEGDTRAPEEE